jgi:hypothetical protein
MISDPILRRMHAAYTAGAVINMRLSRPEMVYHAGAWVGAPPNQPLVYSATIRGDGHKITSVGATAETAMGEALDVWENSNTNPSNASFSAEQRTEHSEETC